MWSVRVVGFFSLRFMLIGTLLFLKVREDMGRNWGAVGSAFPRVDGAARGVFPALPSFRVPGGPRTPSQRILGDKAPNKG